jgi:hypothetical protein
MDNSASTMAQGPGESSLARMTCGLRFKSNQPDKKMRMKPASAGQ